MKSFTLPKLSASRPITILLITHDQLVRVDYSSKGVALDAVVRCPRPMGEELPALVDAAMRLGRRRPKRVWVLCSEVWTQVLSLHSSATNNINDAELARALTFEAEALSGLSAFDSEAAFVPVGAEQSQKLFWIVQLPRWQRDQLEEAVRQAGGTLAGVAHPAALPMLVRGESTGRWQRVELWSHAVVAVEGEGPTISRVHIVNADPRSHAWHEHIESWFSAGSSAPREQLTEDVSFVDEFTPSGTSSTAPTIILDDDATFGEFLGRWAQHLASAKVGVPFLRPAPRPLTRQQRGAVSAALAVVVALVFAGDRYLLMKNIASARGRAADIKGRMGQLDALKKQATEAEKQREKELKDLETVRADVEKTELELAGHRTRWSQLLVLLADRCPEHLVVEAISDSGGRVMLTGESLGPDAANELATALGAELRTMGWYVQPARKESGKSQFSGEPWKFTLELNEMPFTAASVAQQPAAPAGRPNIPTSPDRVVRFGPSSTTPDR